MQKNINFKRKILARMEYPLDGRVGSSPTRLGVPSVQGVDAEVEGEAPQPPRAAQAGQRLDVAHGDARSGILQR